MTDFDISKLGKGCLPDKFDSRDYTITNEALGAPQVVWQPDYQPSNLLFTNQHVSLACTAFGVSYYAQKLHNTVYSKHDLYSRIYQPNGGAYLRDAIVERVKRGQSTWINDPDPGLPNETDMRQPGHGPRQLDDRDGFVIVNHTIDGIAAAIDNYDGVLFGLMMSNEGWKDVLNPRPPLAGEALEGHALYAEGRHLHDGIKCVLGASTWLNHDSGPRPEYHHIKEDYFLSGYTFNPWVLLPRQTMLKLIKEKTRPETYALINGKAYWIRSNDTLDDMVAEKLADRSEITEQDTPIESKGVIA